MLVSILHRVTGGALAIAGLALLVWWLSAIADGADAYGELVTLATHPVGVVVLVGITWAFFQHLMSGVRHLQMDSGAGFEIGANKRFAILTIVISLILTAVVWALFLGVLK